MYVHFGLSNTLLYQILFFEVIKTSLSSFIFIKEEKALFLIFPYFLYHLSINEDFIQNKAT